MCGIVAIISKQKGSFRFKDGDLFKQMLYADALRGFDSTGTFGVNKYNNLKLVKAAQPAATFLTTKTFEDFKTDMFSKYKVVVGHNRAATKGATTDENAHPFIEDHICLVHNGTLTGHKQLADKEVDSHAICHAFATKGAMETLPELNGAYALIWYDAKEKKIFIARNDARPLWLLQTPEADFIASEPGMLSWLVQRVHGNVEKPVYFSTDRVYSYDLDNLDKGYTSVEKPKKALPVVVQPSQTQVTRKMKKAMRLSGQSSCNLDTNSSDKPAGDLKMGDRVHFTYNKATIQGNLVKVDGFHITNKKQPVSGYLDTQKFTADQLEHILEYTTEFYGSYRGYSVKRDKSLQLFLENVQPVYEYYTLNGNLVNDRQLQDAGNCCHECGEIIDPLEQENEFWVRVNNSGDIKEIKCPTCVAQHPHLSKLLEKKCTKESSSSATSSVPSHSVH